MTAMVPIDRAFSSRMENKALVMMGESSACHIRFKKLKHLCIVTIKTLHCARIWTGTRQITISQELAQSPTLMAHSSRQALTW